MSYEVIDLVNDFPHPQETSIYEVVDLVSPKAKKRRASSENVVDLTAELSSKPSDGEEVKIQKEIVIKHVRVGVTCPICLESKDVQLTGPCGHLVCELCMDKLMKTTRKCPSCRVKLTAQKLRKVYLNTEF